MTDAELPPGLTRLTFHGPLSEVRVARIVARLTANRPRTVLDICVGASHALTEVEPPGHTAAALAELRRLVNPGGRVLLGEGFWHRTPTEAELAGMWPGTTAGEFGDLAGLADLAVGAGFRPAWIETATLEEWEDFESGYQCDEEEWLAAHPGHPGAAELRERVDQHRSFWLRGYYGLLGQAYLTLVPVG